MNDVIWMVAGIIGMVLIISIIYFIYKSEHNKNLGRADYTKKVNPSFLIMMSLLVLFSICLSLVMDVEILSSILIGTAFLAVVLIYIYFKPNGIEMKL